MVGFLKNKYWENIDYLWGLIEPEQFDDIVERSSKEVCLAYSHNRKKNNEGVHGWIQMSLFISTCLLLCFFFLMYYGIKEDDNKVRIAGFFALGISVFITTVVAMGNIFKSSGKNSSFFSINSYDLKDLIKKVLKT